MKKNPVRNLRESDVRRMKKEATNEAIRYTTIVFLSVMRDKEGYGVKRLNRLYKEIEALSQSIADGYVSLGDLERALEEEANITVGR